MPSAPVRVPANNVFVIGPLVPLATYTRPKEELAGSVLTATPRGCTNRSSLPSVLMTLVPPRLTSTGMVYPVWLTLRTTTWKTPTTPALLTCKPAGRAPRSTEFCPLFQTTFTLSADSFKRNETVPLSLVRLLAYGVAVTMVAEESAAIHPATNTDRKQ